MNWSLYSSPKFYTLAMRVLYWPHFDTRYRVVAELVPHGASVVDACCGDAYIYSKFLRHKKVKYVGLDSSPAMVTAGVAAGLDIRLWNALDEVVPAADVVIMQGALCHFIPNTARIVSKLRTAARELVIISEPFRQKPHSDIPLVSALSKTFTQPLSDDGNYRGDRFTERELKDLFESQHGHISTQIIPGGREMLGVLRGSHCSAISDDKHRVSEFCPWSYSSLFCPID